MADKCHICLLGLIIICSLLTGTSGAEVTRVFSSSGENVRLPCNNALSDCTSTSWIYSRQSVTVELITGGKKKNNIERHERLSLGSDCSLNIEKVTKEDNGFYICRQYVNGEQQGADALVNLLFLHVSSSSSQTEIRPGSSVTLFCQLYYDRVSCDTLVRTEGVQLIWVNQAGVNLQTDSRYQISFSSGQCISTLTTTLLNEDHNREWRCLVTQRNELKTSVTYTVKYPTPFETKTVTPVSSSRTTTTVNTPVTSTHPDPVDTTSETLVCMTYVGFLFRVIVIIVEIAVFAAPTVILLQIICARRAGRKDHHSEEIKIVPRHWTPVADSWLFPGEDGVIATEGNSGEDDSLVFYRSGENVRLPCNNALSDCTSTTWIYSRRSETVELITLGIKKNDIERHERLSLDSDCSLNIKKATKEDYGFYICRQDVNGEQQGTDARVHLNVLQGSNGAEDTHTFCSSGENVRLPCNNALSDCASTTWIYSRQSESVELTAGGEKKNNIERHERLSLGSDCSLNIKKVAEEDNGSYSCRQYVNGEQQGADARVYLHFLHVSLSSSQTEIRPGSSVTLSCQLYYDGVSCDYLVRTEGVQLIWVNRAGVNLQTDSRYQISPPGQCISTLTTTLLNKDHNREWRCLVTQRKVKTSVKYIVKYSAPVNLTRSSSNSEKKSSQTTAAAPTIQDPAGTKPETVSMTAGSLFRVIVIIVEIAVYAAPTVILLQIICARRAGET
ncbi:hypothetical protein G5714_016180 [Onychostoma macrolepis]|uniref:Ig-like domain-containing protein n=1 Tax=Onychostoma macrolepis TaxID=369639 RepID=A0A7J6C7N4_9TELE|nr:hypothetical protein G5714_016180 [Onychostoma macrolepis]